MPGLPTVGFALLTHDRVADATRLVRTLTATYDEPPIAWHHDPRNGAVPTRDLPANATLIDPPVATQWAHFSVVEAALKCFGELYGRDSGPDWCALVSGSDYPVRSGDVARAMLAETDADVYGSVYELASPADLEPWLKNRFDRYRRRRLGIPGVGRVPGLRRLQVTVSSPPLGWPLFPFTKGRTCWTGSTWFVANRRAIRAALDLRSRWPQLTRYYARRAHEREQHLSVHCPDESYFHTLFGNCRELRWSNGASHYADWTAGGPHPATLTEADLPQMLESSALFARKFDPRVDRNVLDELDRLLDVPPSSGISRRG